MAGDGSARAEEGERSTAAGPKPESVVSAAEIHKPHGGHRPGTGRLGADAYTGAERALKLFIRQRNNSLFYKNAHSAYIASVLTSLIATCLYAGVNAVEYLVALQEHRGEVWADPAAWLPWAYARSRAAP